MAARDLSAFAAPAESPVRRSPERPGKTGRASPRRTSGTARSSRSSRGSSSRSAAPRPVRITLNLPVVTAERLRSRAEEESTFYLDVVVHCFAAYSSAQPEPATDGFRRRPPAGRIQIPLNVAADVLAAIDAVAERAGNSRSAYLTRALDHELS